MNYNFRFRNARDARELYNIFNLRRDVLVGDLGRISIDDVFDDYDAGAVNFFAYNEDGPLGVIRVITIDDLKSIYPEFIEDYMFSFEKRVDLSKYVNGDKKPEEISRLVTHPNCRGKGMTAGLFACIYKHGKEEGVTDLFIIANCEMNPGRIEIPQLYGKLGFKRMDDYDILPKHYDNFDVHSVPMHTEAEEAARRAETLTKRMRRYKGIDLMGMIDYESLTPEERASMFREASEWFIDEMEKSDNKKAELVHSL